jgi:hypothetical protein
MPLEVRAFDNDVVCWRRIVVVPVLQRDVNANEAG